VGSGNTAIYSQIAPCFWTHLTSKLSGVGALVECTSKENLLEMRTNIDVDLAIFNFEPHFFQHAGSWLSMAGLAPGSGKDFCNATKCDQTSVI